MELSNAYVAGLFDGEGCFYIAKTKRAARTKGYFYQPQAIIAIREKYILEELQKKFGGSLVWHKLKNPNAAQSFKWTLNAGNLEKFLDAVQPYLILKKRQAELLREYFKFKSTKEKKYAALSDSEWNTLDDIRNRMCALNKKGVVRLTPDWEAK